MYLPCSMYILSKYGEPTLYDYRETDLIMMLIYVDRENEIMVW